MTTMMMMMIKSPLPYSSSSSYSTSTTTNNKTVALINPPNLISSSSSSSFLINKKKKQRNPNKKPLFLSFGGPPLIIICCCSHSSKNHTPPVVVEVDEIKTIIKEDEDELKYEDEWRSEVGSPPTTTIVTPPPSNFSFLLLSFFAFSTCVAFTSFVIAAIPALHAMGRAAISFSKLADTAREELPSTMAAIRLSSMEISDLTLELSDLSQEITKGVDGSAQVVQAAEAGIRQMGSRAHQQTMSMIEERANLPDLSLQPVVVGAAKKTSRAVGRATKTLMNMFSKGDGSPDDENADAIERLEI